MLSILTPRLLATGLSLAALCGSAAGQFSVDPTLGTAGTRLTLTAEEGVDFGTKPKVSLIQDGSKKQNVLKTISATANEIVVEIKKVDKKKVGETFHVRVQPKGKGVEPIIVEDIFGVCDIVLTDGQPVELTSNVPNVLNAQCMGSKPARVKIGKKPAKVTDWDPDSGAGDGGAIIGSFAITPHKKLANGVYDLEIKTKAGTQVFENAVTVTGSTAGKPKKTGVSGTFGKFKFKPHPKVAKELVAIETPLGDTQITAVANKGTKVTYQLLLKLDWQLDDGDAILDEKDFFFEQIQFQVNTIKGSLFNPTIETDFYTFTDVVLSVCASGDRMLGTFSGTMTRDAEASNGSGPATIEVTKGEFNLPVVNGGV